jgi:hypothetical protein
METQNPSSFVFSKQAVNYSAVWLAAGRMLSTLKNVATTETAAFSS